MSRLKLISMLRNAKVQIYKILRNNKVKTIQSVNEC